MYPGAAMISSTNGALHNLVEITTTFEGQVLLWGGMYDHAFLFSGTARIVG